MLCDKAYGHKKYHNKSRLKSDQISLPISNKIILESSIIYGVFVPSPVAVIRFPSKATLEQEG